MADNSIYRISVEVQDYQELELTGPAISVAADREYRSDRFDLWYEHYNADGPALMGLTRNRALYVLGTGHPAPWTAFTRYAFTFLGTIVTPSGLVWHVYTGPTRDQVIPL